MTSGVLDSEAKQTVSAGTALSCRSHGRIDLEWHGVRFRRHAQNVERQNEGAKPGRSGATRFDRSTHRLSPRRRTGMFAYALFISSTGLPSGLTRGPLTPDTS